jgi:Flp pilus assembly protein TadG
MTNKIPVRDERGQTVTEFALVLPLLMLVLLAILQFGVLFRDYLAVTDAVRAGARKGAVSRHVTAPGGPNKACEDAVKKAATDLNIPPGPTGLIVTCTSTWGPGDDLVVTATYPFDISLFGKVVKNGRFSSATTERVE